MVPNVREGALEEAGGFNGAVVPPVEPSRAVPLHGATPVLRILDPGLFEARRAEIFRLEEEAYEPARRHSADYLRYVVSLPGSLCLLAMHDDTVVGFALAGPLEHFPMKRGTQADEHWGKGDTLYSADIVVEEGRRAQGIARLLKTHQVRAARDAGYRRVTGRNRIGVAVAMWRVNLSLGARILQTLEDEYMDDIGPRGCWYYEIDLGSAPQVEAHPGERSG